MAKLALRVRPIKQGSFLNSSNRDATAVASSAFSLSHCLLRTRGTHTFRYLLAKLLNNWLN